ncbi:hypothetical protein Sm713_71160 [Streptomyces sp. TS71-3]|nr:hypothetical protein Sm713_71160 [Streptomyces sp. TS71-3]
MSRSPEPRKIILDCVPAVVLTPEDFDRFDLVRCQLGGQSARMSALNRDLSLAVRLLEEARAGLSATTECSDDCPAEQSGTEPDHLCCRIRSLLDSPRFARLDGRPAKPTKARGSGDGRQAADHRRT